MRQLRIMLSGLVAAGLSGAASPPAAQAHLVYPNYQRCMQWNISPSWGEGGSAPSKVDILGKKHGDRARLVQSNGYQVQFDFDQQGSRLLGAARGFDSRGVLRLRGRVDGYVSRLTTPRVEGVALVKFDIDWTPGPVGAYEARIYDHGRVGNGRTWDKTHPQSTATWRLHSGHAHCDLPFPGT
jgi:hypothetical protein